MRVRALRVAALAGSVVACGGDHDTPRVSSPSTAIDAMTLSETDAGAPVEPSVEPSLELGTGFSVFAPLEPDQGIEIIAGPQGGFHLWASLRTHGLSSATTWRIECAFTRDGEVLAQANYGDRLVTPTANDPSGLDYLGIAVVFADTEPMSHDGRAGALSCRLSAPDDPAFDAPEVLNRLTDSIEVVPRCCKR
jgi:hypothetical protein